MANKQLSRVKALPDTFLARLGSNGILTCKDFLTRSPLELMNIVDLTYPRVQHLITAVSTACVPASKTVLSMHQGMAETGTKFLPTSIPGLDSILKGGLPPSMITEVSGPSGCGKTQFCMMLCVQSALPLSVGGRGTPVIYVDTEGAFSAERLIEMARCWLRSHSTTTPPSADPNPQTPGEQTHLMELAKRVHVYRHMTSESFLECLAGLDVVLASEGAGLLIVDSIASLARKEFDVSTSRGAMERTALLLKQSARLKYLAETFNIQVVVTNQIVTKLSHDVLELSTHTDTSGVGGDVGVVTSALGNAWYHSINTRLLLEQEQGSRRMLSVIKSPVCKTARIWVKVEEMGLIQTTSPSHSAHSNEVNGVEQQGSGLGSVNPAYHRGFAVEFPGQLPLPTQ